MIFGISDALTRQTVEIITAHSFLAALSSWPPYCLVATSLVALWLMESSFNSAPLHASLPAITAAEPVTGILLGVVVFGDVIHVSPELIALQAVGLVTLVTGVILVARAPALSSLRPKHLVQSLPTRGKPATAPAAAGTPPEARPGDRLRLRLGDRLRLRPGRRLWPGCRRRRRPPQTASRHNGAGAAAALRRG